MSEQTVNYLTFNFEPATEKTADLVEVHLVGGGILFLFANEPEPAILEPDRSGMIAGLARALREFFNPSQPRHPAGSEQGGEWSPVGKSGQAAGRLEIKAIAGWKPQGAAAPDGKQATFTPEEGGVLFHGTSMPDDEAYLIPDKDGVIYLTDDYDEASSYAAGEHLGGHEGGTPRVVNISLSSGRMADIQAEIDSAIGNGDEFTEIFDAARDQGYDYAFYMHPSFHGDEYQRVVVDLNPGAHEGDIWNGWNIETGRKWRRPNK